MNPAGKIAVLVNDRPHELSAAESLRGLLAGLGLENQRGVAAAVNGEVVPRDAWRERVLADRDRVLVIRATQGG